MAANNTGRTTTVNKKSSSSDAVRRTSRDTAGKRALRQRKQEAARKRKKLKIIAAVLAVLTVVAVICSVAYFQKDNLSAAFSKNEDAEYTVYLDAGHGFGDPGCDSELLDGCESETTLEITSILKKALEKKGVRVVLTHDGKTYPSAEKVRSLAKENGVTYKESYIVDNDVFSAYERAVYVASMAEKEKIDLLLSLHVNSIENKPDISQYEIYYYEENPCIQQLEELCNLFAEDLDNDTKIFSTEYNRTFVVTRFGEYPSLLFEMGYCTNERDAKNLNSNSWRKDFCETLAENILEWLETQSKENI